MRLSSYETDYQRHALSLRVPPHSHSGVIDGGGGGVVGREAEH